MKIGIISDTHNNLPEDVLNIFQGVDLILHAGDIGPMEILDKLKKVAPTEAVYGNTDIYSIASQLPSKINLNLEGIQILLLHNIGTMSNFTWNLKRGKYKPEPKMIIFGHTHAPYFKEYMEYIFINPGSAGMPRGGYQRSVMLLNISNGEVKNHKLVRIKHPTGAK